MILVDTREQKWDYITSFFEERQIPCQTSTLAHGMDYLIAEKHGSIGIQRKDFSEVAQQMPEIKKDIVPSLLELTENPVLLIEETFSIGANGLMWRKESGFLKETELMAKSYYNFIYSIKQMGCDVICTRSLDHSLWWMDSIHSYLMKEHYPKPKVTYGTDMQALGMFCCISGFGVTAGRKILKEHSVRELVEMKPVERSRVLTNKQREHFETVINAKIGDG